MVNKYWNEIVSCRDEIYTLQRKALTKADESSDILYEEEEAYSNLIRLASLAEEEELDLSEKEQLEQILEEVEKSRQSLRTDIRAKF